MLEVANFTDFVCGGDVCCAILSRATVDCPSVGNVMTLPNCTSGSSVCSGPKKATAQQACAVDKKKKKRFVKY